MDYEKILKLGKEAKVSGSAMEKIKAHWETICEMLGKGLSVEDVAVAMTKRGVEISRRSIFNFLKAINVSAVDIKHAYIEHDKRKKLTKAEKLVEKERALKVLPSEIESFKQLPIMQEIISDMKAQGVTSHHLNRCIRTIYELCSFTQKMPEDIDEVDIRNFVEYMKGKWLESGKDLRKVEVASQFSTDILSPLRVFCKARGLPIKPYLKTCEYTSPYRSVRITPEQRYMILKWLKENKPKDYEFVRDCIMLLYYTGSRAKALSTARVIITEKYGEKVAYVQTREKGRRKEIMWEKVIPMDLAERVSKILPLTDRQVKKLRKILKEAYEHVLEKGTLTYYYAMRHQLHVWRHTACNDLLEASNWNLMLVAKQLGWKNVSMITLIYGEMSEEMRLKMLGYDIKVEQAKFEFLPNHYREKAKKEGLL